MANELTPVDQEPQEQETPGTPVQPKQIDVFSAVKDAMGSMGKNYNSLDQAASMYPMTNSGYQATLQDAETTWQQHAGDFQNNRSLFDNVYNTSLNMFKNMSQMQYDFPLKSNNAPETLPEAMGFSKAPVSSYMIDANPDRTADLTDVISTPSQIASSTGKMINKSGVEEDFSQWDQFWNNKNPLVVDTPKDAAGNPIGNPYLREMNDNESKYGKEIFSLYGSKGKTASALFDFSNSLYNGLIDIPRSVNWVYNKYLSQPFMQLLNQGLQRTSTFGEDTIVDPYGQTWYVDRGDEESKKRLANVDQKYVVSPSYAASLLQKNSQYWLDQSDARFERLKAPVSEKAATQGVFGGLNGAAASLGQGISFLIPGMAAQKAMMAGEVLEGMSAFRQAALAQRMGNAGSVVSTAQMAPITYDMGREAGLGDEEATIFSLVALPGAMISEKMLGSKWVTNMFLDPVAKNELKSAINTELKKYISAGGGKLTPSGMLGASQMASRKIISAVSKYAQENIEAKGLVGAGIRATEGAFKESAQEGVEQAYYNAIENIYDKYFSEKDSTVGKGKFGMEFFSDKSMEDLFQNAAGGMLVGGVMAGMRKGHGKQGYQNNLFSKAVANGDDGFVESYINKLHKEGQLGETFINEQGQTMNSTEMADGSVRSMNDVNKESLLGRLNYHRGLKTELGIANPALMSAVEGDKNLFKEAIDITRDQKEFANSIQDLQDQKAELSIKGENTDSIDKQIQSINESKATNDERLKDIISGKAVSDNLKNTAIGLKYAKELDDDTKKGYIPSSKGVDDFNTKVSDSVKYWEEKKIKQAEESKIAFEKATTISQTLATDVANTKELNKQINDLSNLSSAFYSASTEDILKSIQDSKNKLFGNVESFVSEKAGRQITDEEKADSDLYEENLQAEALNLGLDKDVLTNLHMLDKLSASVASKIGEKADSKSDFDADLSKEDGLNYGKVDVYISPDGVQDYNEHIDGLSEMEGTPELMKILEMLKQDVMINDNIADINKDVFQPMSESHSRMPKDSKLTEKEYNEIKKKLALAKESAEKALIKFNQDLLSKSNRDRTIREEDMKIRYNFINQLTSKLPALKEDSDKAFDALVAKDFIKAEQFILRMEESFYNLDPKEKEELALKTIENIALSRRLVAADGKGISGRNYTSSNEFTFNSFDSLFNLFTANEEIDWSKTTKANFVVLYLTNYLNNIQRISPSDFYNSYEEVLAEYKDGENVASFEQEMAVRHSVAHYMANGDNSFIQKANEIFTRGEKGEKNDTRNQTLDKEKFYNNFLAIRGFAGTGKTTTISKLSLKIISKGTGSKVKVSIMAPSSALAEKFRNVIAEDSEFSTISNMETFFKSDFETQISSLGKGSDLLMVDEASVLDRAKLSQLNNAVAKINAERAGSKLDPMRVWLYGDQSQMSSIDAKEERYSLFESRMERTLPLSTLFRTDVVDIGLLQESIRNAMFSDNKGINHPSTKYNAELTEGVKYYQALSNNTIAEVLNNKDLVADITKSILTSFNNDAVTPDMSIIVYSPAEAKYVTTALYNNTDLSKVDKDFIDKCVKHLGTEKGSVLGLDFDKVFALIPDENFSKDQSGVKKSRALLTAATRAKSFAGVLVENKNATSQEGSVMMTKPESNADKLKKKNELSERIDGITTQLENVAQFKKKAPVAPVATPTKGKKGKKVTAATLKTTKVKAVKKATAAAKKAPKTPAVKKTKAPIVPPAPVVNVAVPVYTPEFEITNKTFNANKFMASSGAMVGINPIATYLDGNLYDVTSQNPKTQQLAANMKFLAQAEKSNNDLDKKVILRFLPEITKGNTKFFNVIQIEVHPSQLDKLAKCYDPAALMTPDKLVEQNLHVIGMLDDPKRSTADKIGNLNADFYSNPANRTRAYADIEKGFKGNQAMIEWNKMLVDLRFAGINKARGIIGTPSLNGLERGYFVKGHKSIPVDEFLKTVVGLKGFYWDGTVIQDNKAYMEAVPGVGELGRIGTVIEISAAQGLPATKIIINAPEMKAGDIDAVKSEITKLLKRKKTIEFSELKTTLAYRTSMYNSNALNALGFNNEVLDKGEVAETLIDRMKKAWDEVANKNVALYQLTDIVRSGDTQLISNPNLSQFTTNKKDVFYPTFYVNLSQFVQKATFTQPNVSTKQNNSAFKSMGGKPKIKNTTLTLDEVRVAREKVTEYFSKVFGDDYVNGKLFFKPNLSLRDAEVYGYMENGNVHLEETADGIEKFAPRHEAVHVALDYLITPESRKVILDEVKNIMAQKNQSDPSVISDDDAHEYIAELNEKRYEGVTGKVKQFLDWVKNIFSKWASYRTETDKFLHQLEYGKFKDEPFELNTNEPFERAKKKKKKEDPIEPEAEQEDESSVDYDYDEEAMAKIYGAPENTDEKKYSDYISLKKHFGDTSVINYIKDIVGNMIRQRSDYNKNIFTDSATIPDGIDGTMQYARQIQEEYGDEISPLTLPDGTVINSLEQINGDNLHYIDNPEARARYIFKKLGETEVMFRFAKKIFSGMDIEKAMYSREEKDTSHHSVDNSFEDAVYENSESTIQGNNLEKNYLDSMSSMVKWNLRLNVKEYVKQGTGVYTYTTDEFRFINSKQLHRDLVEASMLAFAMQGEFEVNFKSSIKDMIESRVIDNNPAATKYDKSANDLLNFYNEYLNEAPQVIEPQDDGSIKMTADFLESFDLEGADSDYLTDIGDKSFSHSFIANHAQELASFFPEHRDRIIAKRQKSIVLTNAIISTFKSISKKSTVQQHVDREGNVKLVRQDASDMSGVKGEISRKLDNKMFDGHYALRKGFASRINNDYVITPNAITDSKTGKKLISIFPDKSGRVGNNSFILNPAVGYDDLNKMKSSLGLKLRKNTWSLFLSGKNPKFSNNSLAEVLGVWMLSAKILSDEKFPSKNMLDGYYEKGEADTDLLETALSSDQSVQEKQDISEDEEGTYIKRPSDFFRLKELLAEAESISRGNGNNRKTYNIKNKAQWSDTFTNTFHRLLGYNSDERQMAASAGLKQDPSAIMQANPDFVPRYNAFSDPQSNSSILRVAIQDGTKDRSRGKKYSELRDSDHIKTVVDGGFIKSIMPSLFGDKEEKIVHVSHPMADKNDVPVFEVRLGEDKGDKLISKKNGRVEIGWDLVTRHFARIYYQHRHSQNNSVNRWINALKTSPLGIKDNFFDSHNPEQGKVGFYSDPETLVTKMQLLNNEAKNSPLWNDHIKHLQKSGLIDQHDVIWGDNNPLPGQATLYGYDYKTKTGNPLFNQRRMLEFETIRKSGDKEAMKTFLKALIAPQYNQLINYFYASGYKSPMWMKDNTKMPKDQSLFFNEEYGVDENGEDVLITDKGTNPVYEAFLLSYIINDHYTSQLIMGESTYFSNVKQLFARGSGPLAPGKALSRAIPEAGIGSKLKIAVVKGLGLKVYDHIKPGYSNTTNVWDGYSIANPIFSYLAHISDGGEMGQMGDSMQKPQYYFQGFYFKTGMMPITANMIENSDMYMDMFRKMNGPIINGLYDQYRAEGLSFNQAIARIGSDISMDPSLRDDIKTDIVADQTSIKSGMRYLNDIEDNEWAHHVVPSEHFHYQLNPSQDITDTKLANNTQVATAQAVGANNTARSKETASIQATLAQLYMNQLMTKKNKYKGDDRSKYMQLLRDIGKRSANAMGDASRFVDEINNADISLDLPTVRFKLLQFLNNRVTQNAIKTKLNGVRSNQVPASGIQIYDTPNGPMLKADAIKAGIDVSQSPGRSLKPMTIEDGKIVPGEVIMPFSYVEQFGVTSDMSLHEMRAFLVAQGDEAKLSAFEEALKVVLTRTPAGSSSAGFIANVTGFFNDEGNAVFIPEEHNILTGGDFDIDQLSDFFAIVDKDGHLPLEGEDNLRNRLIANMYNYYTDAENADIFLTPTELSGLKKLSTEMDGNVKIGKFFDKDLRLLHNDPTTAMYLHNAINAGKDLTGFLANGNKTSAMLTFAQQQVGQPLTNGWNFPTDGKALDGSWIITHYNNLIDASTTNQKNNILGSLGFTPEIANSINAFVASGHNDITIANVVTSKPVKSVVRSLRKKLEFNEKNQNEFGKRYSIFDAIEDARVKIEGRVSEDRSKYYKLVNQLDKSSKAKKGKGKLKKAEVEELQRRIAEWETKWLPISDPIHEKELESERMQLNMFEQMSYVGEALKRLNDVVKINTGGLAVEDFETEKNIRNIENALNMPLEDFLANKEQKDQNWFLINNKYLEGDIDDPKTELGKFVEREKKIRGLINVPATINQLPHIKAYLQITAQMKQISEKTFMQDSKLFKDIKSNWLSDVKMDQYNYDGQYYGFQNEMWRYVDAMFFEKYYHGKKFEAITSIFSDFGKHDITTPGGRYSFGQEAPELLRRIIQEEIAKGNKLASQNSLINRLNIAYMDEVPEDDKSIFVELENLQDLSPEEFADMRGAFEKLDDIRPGFPFRETLWLLNKMRFGFQFKKGSIGEAMSVSEFDVNYSDFLGDLSATVQKYETDPECPWITGKGDAIPVKDLFNNFTKSVGAYNNDLVQSVDMSKRASTFPNTYKYYERETRQMLIYDNVNGTQYTSKYIDRFNPYDIYEPSVSKDQSLKTLTFGQYKQWKLGGYSEKNPMKIIYGKKVVFSQATPSNKENGLINMPDGSLGIVKNVSYVGKQSVITIVPYFNKQEQGIKALNNFEDIDKLKEVSKYNLSKYVTMESKDAMTAYMASQATTQSMRDLFAALASKRIPSRESVGRVAFSTKETDPKMMNLYVKNKSNEIGAYYDPRTSNIVFNKSVLNNSGFMVEQLYAHESLHGFTHNAITMYASGNKTLSQEGKVFGEKMEKLFNSATAWAKENNMQDVYGFSNIDEFVSESFSNSNFQKIMMNIGAVEDVKANSSIFSKFVSSLSDFIYSLTGIKQDESLLHQVINVTGEYIETTDSSEFFISKEPSIRRGNLLRSSIEHMDELDNIVNSLKNNIIKLC